ITANARERKETRTLTSQRSSFKQSTNVTNNKGSSMVESFESYRSYLFAIAYRMLGSAMDAEDMVQETYLRYSTTPPETIRTLKAFLPPILTRLCVDQLQLARRKREVYVGPW